MRVVIILLYSSVSSIGALGDSCQQWFEESGIDASSKDCLIRCASLRVSLDTFSCHSDCRDFCIATTKVWAYFGNGVFNTPEDAKHSAKVFGKQLKAYLSSKHPDLISLLANPGPMEVAYNFNEPWAMQILQAVVQKGRSEERFFFKRLAELSDAPAWFRELVRQKGRLGDEAFQITDSDLREHLSRYRKHLKDDDGVLIIPHSQGNMYATAAISILNDTNKWAIPVRINPIASPLFEETHEDHLNDAAYTTLTSDGVIRLLSPHHLPPNCSNQPSGSFDHEFIKHYVRGNNSGPKIFKDTSCLLSLFIPQEPSLDTVLGQAERHVSCEGEIGYPGLRNNEE